MQYTSNNSVKLADCLPYTEKVQLISNMYQGNMYHVT